MPIFDLDCAVANAIQMGSLPTCASPKKESPSLEIIENQLGIQLNNLFSSIESIEKSLDKLVMSPEHNTQSNEKLLPTGYIDKMFEHIHTFQELNARLRNLDDKLKTLI